MVHHILAYGRVGRGIQYPLRGDERHDSAFTHRVKAFQEKVIVYRPCHRAPCRILAAAENSGSNTATSPNGILETATSKWFMNGFSIFSKPCTLTFCPGCRCFSICARHQVFLKSHDVRVRSVLQHGVHECTDTCRRLQHPVGTDAVFMPARPRWSRLSPAGYRRRSARTAFMRIHKPLVLCFVSCCSHG